MTADPTAASGARLQNPNANAAKLGAALPEPVQAFELTFDAEAGKAYRIWLRGKALGDHYTNDSVFVQFSGSVDAAGNPVWRTGTTDATIVVLEDCSGCGLQGWGWADNAYGVNDAGAAGVLREHRPAAHAHPGARRRDRDRSGRAVSSALPDGAPRCDQERHGGDPECFLNRSFGDSWFYRRSGGQETFSLENTKYS